MLLYETVLIVYWFSIYLIGEYLLEIFGLSIYENIMVLTILAIVTGYWLKKYEKKIHF